ncbi:MAG TPA: spirocyclase AveC family protein [Acidimicrobiales bacterium]|nr:spirocyclase AveC family protein [Acidimicrobiales bacterium]
MTTQLARSPSANEERSPTTEPPEKRDRRAVIVGLTVFAVLACAVVVGHNARHGAVASRIKNPALHIPPSHVAPLFGWTHWLGFLQYGTVISIAQIIVIFTVAWWRWPKHPILLMAIACTSLIWQDPIMNWAPYAVYNPALWHWPETWPLVSISPTVEPFVVFGYVTFYLLPGLVGIWIVRRIQRRRPVTSFVWQHPLITLAIIIYVVGFTYDAIQEILLVRMQLYIYSQVIPFGSVFSGKPYQFPLLWESTLVTAVMIPAGVLLYRDDTGRTEAEKLARRLKAFQRRPALGSFLVMALILNACYLFLYGGSFAIIRASGAATSVACPYPFPTAKVYDPQGYYEKAGEPGPYSAGIWDGWETGQSGRPNVAPPPSGGRCSTKNS